MIHASNATDAHAQGFLRDSTAHPERIRTLNSITTLYSKYLMFSVCVVAEFYCVTTSSSPLFPPIVNTLRTAPDTPTLQGSDHLRVCQQYLKIRSNELKFDTNLVELLRVETSNYEQDIAAHVCSDGLIVTQELSGQRQQFGRRQELVDTHEVQQPLQRVKPHIYRNKLDCLLSKGYPDSLIDPLKHSGHLICH